MATFDLDHPILHFSPGDPWTIRDACEGTQIFGALGSGKTSGSGKTIAKAFLRAGFGGLVLTAKPDERQLWERYCRETGRQESLVIFSPSQPWRFNFLDYEMQRPGVGAGLTENLTNLFTTVLEAGGGHSGQGAGSDPYWTNATKQLLRNAIDLLAISTQRLSLPEIANIIATAPQSREDLHDADWKETSVCYRHLRAAYERSGKTEREERDFQTSWQYWTAQFPTLAEKTRSSIVSIFTGMADGFLRGALFELFCTDTTIVPELTHEGVVLVLDLPIKEFGDVGRFAQLLMKHLWQQATERRDPGRDLRPVFLWADESQFFVTAHDPLFQSTARSARACTVYLTQNLSNYYAAIGGAQAKAQVDSLLGNLQTKIFHANGDPVTNNWAADLLSKTWSFATSTTSGARREEQSSTSTSERLAYQVEPHAFTQLKKGGPKNDHLVEAVIFEGGREWQVSKANYLYGAFKQEVP